MTRHGVILPGAQFNIDYRWDRQVDFKSDGDSSCDLSDSKVNHLSLKPLFP